MLPAADALLADCYAEIRRIARKLIRGAHGDLLQPTELVHEAAIRMLRIEALDVHDRGHMLALAARVMRQALIDETRKANAAKRRTPELLTAWPEPDGALISLDTLEDAVTALGQVSTEHAEVVELRFTLGMTVEEAAKATGLSERTVKRRWQSARAWLQRYLEGRQ